MQVQRSVLVDQPASLLFDVIEQAEHYPRFLPWCAGAQVLARDDRLVRAELLVRWHGVEFRVRTRNPKQRPTAMTILLEDGPFRHFQGEWQLTPLAPDACKVVFRLDYAFASGVMTQLAGPVFHQVGNTLVDAFVARAQALAAAQLASVGSVAAGTAGAAGAAADLRCDFMLQRQSASEGSGSTSSQCSSAPSASIVPTSDSPAVSNAETGPSISRHQTSTAAPVPSVTDTGNSGFIGARLK
jgi:ribosome-associated toxin RatA of RatAB toxin-antitoxin module